ncbi:MULTISPECIES: sugar-binding transcriptional regulator [Lactobacillales]|jgi:DNA-binding transcriptional regulator LsrR (DeoR family)|nr:MULTISPECIES: sugar-binding domain-containing protein [Lactobacillales]MDN6104056.1 hypothetical protein [Lacticaseibacillus paracasei]MDN6213352.1 hypothetical protein [Lactiplantibacillus plantarum]MBZ1507158.1 hypothetical protein [Leuconostoc mesenteroides]MBZ1510938.1 hypothetical protein [Leuconostoc mesenteroides]MBZ1531755.1 hypothetical protein [Leuconostoc mesenteroides]
MDEEQLAKIAEDYYLNKLTFGDISHKYKISRYKINKALDQAVKDGVIKIEIRNSNQRNSRLERLLSEQYPGTHFFVIQDDENVIGTSERVTLYAAEKFSEDIKGGNKTVGISWGETINAMIEYAPTATLENVKFVQFLGENLKYNSAADSTHIVERLSRKFSGEFFTLPAPLYILNDLVRKGLYAEPSMQRALTVARNMDFLVTALGTPASLDSIYIWNNNWHSIFPTTRREDIAGYIYGRPYDENGNILNIQNDKIVGLSLDEIMSVPRRVALAQDKSKSLAIRGALRGHLITELIMSESVAFRVLSESKADVLIEQLKQL